MLDTGILEREARRLGCHLTERQLDLFRRYYHELLRWNERVNLTSIVDWEGVQVHHFLDSLTGGLVLPSSARVSPCRVVDIGAGAGFPGLPLKVLFPHIHLTLLESVGKKAAFLRHLLQALGMAEVDVLAVRAEEAGRDPVHRETYDLVVARAVAELPVLLEYGLPLVRNAGLMVAYKGREVEEELASAASALSTLGGRLQEVRQVDLPGLQAPRHLVVVEKVQSTPERYPRRPGIPAKRPLR